MLPVLIVLIAALTNSILEIILGTEDTLRAADKWSNDLLKVRWKERVHHYSWRTLLQRHESQSPFTMEIRPVEKIRL